MGTIKINNQDCTDTSLSRMTSGDLSGENFVPLRDHVVVQKEGSNEFYHLELPAGSSGYAGTPSLEIESDHTGAFTGIIRYFADAPDSGGAPLNTTVIIGGKSMPAQMILVDAVGDDPDLVPFNDEIVISSQGRYYRLFLPSDYNLPEDTEYLSIQYAISEHQNLTFIGKVESANDEHDNAKIKIDHLNITVGFEAGVDLSGGITTTQAEKLRVLVKDTFRLEEGKQYSRKRLDRATRALERKLKDECFDLGVHPKWNAAGTALELAIHVIPPTKGISPEVTLNTPDEWDRPQDPAADAIVKEKIVQNTAEFTSLVLSSYSDDKELTKASMDDNLAFVRETCAKHSMAFEVTGFEILGLDADNRPRLKFYLKPKAERISVTVDDNVQTTTHTNAASRRSGGEASVQALDVGQHGPIGIDQLARAKQKTFLELSEFYARQGKCLVFERDGKIVPFVAFDDDLKVNDDLTLTTDPSIYLQAVPVSNVEFNGLPEPTNDKIQRIFRQGMGRSGKITSRSMHEGLVSLYSYLTLKGYDLVKESLGSPQGGQLDYRIEEGVLKIDAQVYQLDQPVTDDSFQFPSGVSAEDKEKYLKFLKREVVFEAGKPVDRNAITGAIAAIALRTPYQVRECRYVSTSSTDPSQVAIKFILQPKDYTGKYDFMLGAVTDDSGVMPTLSGTQTFGAEGMVYSATEMIGINVGGGDSKPGLGMLSIGASATTPAINPSRDRLGFSGSATYMAPGTGASGVGGEVDYIHPLTPYSPWSVFGGLGINGIAGYDGDGNGMYFGPRAGLRYNRNGLQAEVYAGPRFYSGGGMYGDIGASVYKRWDLTDDGKLYADVWAKTGLLIGAVPSAAMFHSLPISMNGMFLQAPVTLYAGAGASLMYEVLPDQALGGFDIGLGVQSSAVPGLFTAGAGIKIKSRALGMTIMIGPTIVNGVPTPIFISLGNR